jgi:hypothetical protein
MFWLWKRMKQSLHEMTRSVVPSFRQDTEVKELLVCFASLRLGCLVLRACGTWIQMDPNGSNVGRCRKCALDILNFRLVMPLTPPEPGTPEHEAGSRVEKHHIATMLSACHSMSNSLMHLPNACAESCCQVWLKLPPLHPCALLCTCFVLATEVTGGLMKDVKHAASGCIFFSF